jgi:hypothetical protein
MKVRHGASPKLIALIRTAAWAAKSRAVLFAERGFSAIDGSQAASAASFCAFSTASSIDPTI